MIGSFDEFSIPFSILVCHVFFFVYVCGKINCLCLIIDYAFIDCILNCLYVKKKVEMTSAFKNIMVELNKDEKLMKYKLCNLRGG